MFAFSVQARTFLRACYSSVACTCAVSVRVGDDVIVIDSCENSGNLVVQMYIHDTLTPGTQLLQYGGGTKYQV